ncbi:LuxR C-terminal-related transcriptional regulator [Gordonia sp. ABSL1-1]|uniref:LuxR C-terminal-related transcriptional regulator n=1 Tax=Gordonia sp. ABSL1-1 TaxID=3053923 RepID=UPI002572A52E|nr:LuxR C-terminal-related transcriptional regulator [Gordonia sp. ABSL1-1]MDL9935420.1 LuxR C-terminal-related transcriptional regulator [Gordonia sp. ABSL1-1]
MSEVVNRALADALLRIRRDSGVTLAFGGAVGGARSVVLDQFAGSTVGALNGLSVDVGHGLGGKVVSASRPMVVDDYLATPRITHRYNTIIAREGLRAMAAAPVIVDRRPVAVLYGAFHAPHPIGGRMLDVLASEARAAEQSIVAARARLELGAADPDALRDRATEAYARLRALAAELDDPEMVAELVAIGSGLTFAAADVDIPALTGREQDVLSLAALGYSNARIADSLGVTAQTVKGYMKDAMRKLGASTRLEAVICARRAGLLP